MPWILQLPFQGSIFIEIGKGGVVVDRIVLLAFALAESSCLAGRVSGVAPELAPALVEIEHGEFRQAGYGQMS